MLKFNILLLVLCGFLVFSAGSVWADDVSDLKEQVKALQETINNQQKTIESLSSKVQAVEIKQQSQAAEIKKVPELAKAVDAIKEGPAGMMEGASVGGHLKLYMFDASEGIVRGANGENKDAQHNDSSAGIHHLYLYFNKELSDILKLDVAMDNSVSAAATPSIGSDIARTSSASSSTVIHTASITALLPKGAELKTGVFNPMFSEEYAKETWWHEQYHQNQGLSYLESWHDSGIELYKNFDFEKLSLPVYVSLLNGNSSSRYADNNNSKTLLLHIAPELFHTQLRLLGSVAFGNWGNPDSSFQSVAGFDWKHEKLNITSEYIYRKWDDLVVTGSKHADGKREGYYARALYNITPEWVGLLKYSHAEFYKTGSSTMLSDNYDTTTLGLNYNLTPSSTIMGDYSLINGERSNSSASIRANRYTIGWRTTF
ncbi:MAG: hypothetical protein A2047_02225 [Omnitrophica bacterium GWA2_41_15]|nr:MAG: hypothetical protein A2047_02225 [Omnitrophica bacterium GWA2_41_15]HAZ10700.1 hypothetical protein [Candidatus Omnitrophota bacterium]